MPPLFRRPLNNNLPDLCNPTAKKVHFVTLLQVLQSVTTVTLVTNDTVHRNQDYLTYLNHNFQDDTVVTVVTLVTNDTP